MAAGVGFYFGPSYCGNQKALQASSVCCCYLASLLHKMDSLLHYSQQVQYGLNDL